MGLQKATASASSRLVFWRSALLPTSAPGISIGLVVVYRISHIRIDIVLAHSLDLAVPDNIDISVWALGQSDEDCCGNILTAAVRIINI